MSRPVVVVGSANQDVVVEVQRIPLAGETVLGHSPKQTPGGKGLNQACASASAGARTYFVGAVGDDGAASMLLGALGSVGVDVSQVVVKEGSPSGTAHILVAEDGANQIVVVAGSNGALLPAEVRGGLEAVPHSPVTVLQGEIPLECLLEAAKVTEEREGRLVVNLAPVMEVPREFLRHCDPLVVNEHEAGLMLGAPTPSTVAEAKEATERLLRWSPSVIVTIGKQGGVVGTPGSVEHVPPFDVPQVVDTTGAGDAFVGVLSALLAEGHDLLQAAKGATRAAAYSVTRPGASESYSAIREQFGRQ